MITLIKPKVFSDLNEKQHAVLFGPDLLLHALFLHRHTLIWCAERRKSNILSGTKKEQRPPLFIPRKESRTFSKALF